MKICVLGNSHVGALKRAWPTTQQSFHGFQLSFFAQRHYGLKHLVLRGRRLVPNESSLERAFEFTSGGKKDIDIDEYDAFVLYGLGTQANFFWNEELYSRSVVERSLRDLVDSSLSFQLLNLVREVSERRVLLGHDPIKAATNVRTRMEPHDYIQGTQLINDMIYRPVNAEMVLQPLCTLVNGNETDPSFSRGSRRLAVGDKFDEEFHSPAENGHMNESFGDLWLRSMVKCLLSTGQESRADDRPPQTKLGPTTPSNSSREGA